MYIYIYVCVCVYICFVSFCCRPFVLSSDFAMVLSLIVQARTETNVSMVPMKPWPHWCDWPVVVFCPSVTRYGGYWPPCNLGKYGQMGDAWICGPSDVTMFFNKLWDGAVPYF